MSPSPELPLLPDPLVAAGFLSLVLLAAGLTLPTPTRPSLRGLLPGHALLGLLAVQWLLVPGLSLLALGLALPVEASAGKSHFRNQLLITHRGLSGPAILQISNYWQPGEPLRIDLFPQGEAESWLAEQQQARPASELRTVLADLFPKRFAQRFAELHTPANKLMRQLIPAERKAIAAALHAWPISPNGSEGYRTAEVTLGGVDTRELSSTSFESKLAPGLYFIGEVMDVTGWLGGYNFHWAWASAHACAAAL